MRHAEATREAQASAQATEDKVVADVTATRMAAESQATVAALSAAATKEHEMALLAIAQAASAATVAAESTRVEATAMAEFAQAEQAVAAAQVANTLLTLQQQRATVAEKAANAAMLRDIRNGALIVVLFVASVLALFYGAVWAWKQRNPIMIVPSPQGDTTLIRPNTFTYLPRAALPAGNSATVIEDTGQWQVLTSTPVGFGLPYLQQWQPGAGIALGVVMPAGKSRQVLRITHAMLERTAAHVLVCAKTGGGKSQSMLRPMTISMIRDGRFTVYIVDETHKDFGMFAGLPNVRSVLIEQPEQLIEVMQNAYQLIVARGRQIAETGGHNVTTWGELMQVDAGVPKRVALVVDEFGNVLKSLDSRRRQELMTLTEQVASRGRASGVHLFAGIQDPTNRDYPTGARRNMLAVALPLQDDTASRLVLNQGGAEHIQPGQMLVAAPSGLIRANTIYLSGEQARQVVEGEYETLPDPGLSVPALWQPPRAMQRQESAEIPQPILKPIDVIEVLPFLGMGRSRTALLTTMEERGVTGWAKNGENIGRMTDALCWIANNGTEQQRQAVQALRGYPWDA